MSGNCLFDELLALFVLVALAALYVEMAEKSDLHVDIVKITQNCLTKHEKIDRIN